VRDTELYVFIGDKPTGRRDKDSREHGTSSLLQLGLTLMQLLVNSCYDIKF